MSRERAIRREARERERSTRISAATAREQARREKSARKARIKDRFTPTQRPGVLARRKRRRALLVTFFLLIINLFVWLFIPEATIGGIVLTVLVLPLIRTFIIDRRD
ncbi:MAG: hypothetical protein F2664_03910 [Actinobacteria bacterium]|uniref:Unannotated protein n=1 Tax=freshwater metagenome TaxID=449393 RepID=A0A6J6P715_9ZZZZ|nr:hypothetical protein [Actinomycetota bacterium]MSY86817.1 hypothetical protein [Actinomycetota bacterium]MTA50212.1 hypothetical protein [Actinomycetota bacterium]